MTDEQDMAMPTARATTAGAVEPLRVSSTAGVSIAGAMKLPPEAIEAWVNYEPPTIQSGNPLVIANGIMRHAFMAGFLAAQAIEAATAGETHSGSTVGESAVRQDAPGGSHG